ncbi:hypothetical protein QEN19_001683 [Hanseniaspora menglaensis]
MTNVYITVGATIPFDRMIDALFDGPLDILLKQFSSYGKHSDPINIVAQCGATYSELFEKNVYSKLEIPKHSKTEFYNQSMLDTKEIRSVSFISKFCQVNISFFNLSSSLNEFLKEFRPVIVISHAGTGSLLDAMANKCQDNGIIVAVVNDSLMNNHQLEIGEKLESHGLVTCCRNISELSRLIQSEGLESNNKTSTKINTSGMKLQRGFSSDFNSDVFLF